MGYKELKKYTPNHYKNLIRIGNKLGELNIEPLQLLLILDNDEKSEEQCEAGLGNYIENLIDSVRSSDTARVYLNDLKQLIKFNYRYKKKEFLFSIS